MLASESQLALWTKRDRKTVRAKLINLPFENGPKGAKLYEAHEALLILHGTEKGQDANKLTAQEAAKLLTIKRTEEIELNMQVVRRERIPVAMVEEHNDQVLQNCAGILKAHEGKKLTPELIQEIFAEFRRMEEILQKFCRPAASLEETGETPDAWEGLV
jgi:hypothetical protein